MSKIHFEYLLNDSLNFYLEKTASFNDKSSVLICRQSEEKFFEKFSEQFNIKFDRIIFDEISGESINVFDNDKNYFFSNNVITDEIYKNLITKKIDERQIYIGPTQDAYFDLYPKKNVIYENIEKLNETYYLLADDKSRRTFLQIITRLCLPYQYHYFYETADDPQYFPKEFSFRDDEVFLDAGVCDGQNIFEFVECVHSNYKYIYGIEADEDNFNVSKHNLKDINGLELIKGALFSKSGEKLFFRSSRMTGRKGNARVQNDGDILVSSVAGDSLKYSPTFIKMDIEGSEKDALIGLKETIKSQSPKLAVCIYHFQRDFWEIPLLIKKLNPQYNLMIRNHERLFTLLESVCYAYV